MTIHTATLNSTVERTTNNGVKYAAVERSFGAEILGVRLSELTDQAFADVIELYHGFGVLLCRGQQLSDPELIEVGRRFGELQMPGVSVIGKPYIDEHPEILVVSNLVDEQGVPMGNLGAAETSWHTDMSYKQRPIAAALLHALELPARGGGAMYYADMYQAYETLSAELKDAIDGRLLIHDETYNSAGQIRKGFEPVTDPRNAPGAQHPVVRTHPVTKRDALYLGRRRNAYIVGMELEESEQVLDALWAHATRCWIDFEGWQSGDLLIWDNRSTLHLRTGFDPEDRSILHRVQVKGEQPFRQPAMRR